MPDNSPTRRDFLYGALAGSCLLTGTSRSAGASHDDSPIPLANERIALQFDAHTGTLTSLRNLVTSDEYLKEPGSEGNPFRVYVDTTEPPTPLTDPDWWSGAIEGAMGGRIVDTKDCRLNAVQRRRNGKSLILAMEYLAEEIPLTFLLEARLHDQHDYLDLTLTVHNRDTRSHTVLTAFPHFSGIQLGPSRETNLGLMLASFGTPGVPAWQDSGGFHGREVSMQFQAAWDPAINEGIGLIVMDPSLRPKLIRRFPQGGMSALYPLRVSLAPGESHTYPTARLVVHQGSWRVVAQLYGDWFRSAFKVRKSPGWLEDVDLFVGPWIPSAQEVADAKRAGSGFASFTQMPLLYLNDPYDLKEWAQYNEGVVRNPATYGPYMADGTYHPREDLGGPEALREGIRRLHGIGRKAILYVAGNSILRDSEALRGTSLEDWMLMNRPDRMYDIGYPNGMSVCPGYRPWQDHLAATCRRLLAETGADGIRLDELASLVPCFNPAHHHANPFDSNIWLRELVGRVRAAMDEVNPQAILNTESPIDFLHESCTGALQMFQPGTDIDAMRVAIPSYVVFAYHPGAVESGLNGQVGGKTTAHRGDWPWTHRGLQPKPAWYGDGPGPEMRWHELRASFREALAEGSVTLADPETPDAPHWVGRLWRGRHYWILVGGNLDGSPLERPVQVRLPEMPGEIKHAFEFDAATLVRRDAELTRNGSEVRVTMASGFGAVLLPLPGCPPLLDLPPAPLTARRGASIDIPLGLFSPWRAETSVLSVRVNAPGLCGSHRISAPGTLHIPIPADIEPGLYPITLSGTCLGAKRWVRVEG